MRELVAVERKFVTLPLYPVRRRTKRPPANAHPDVMRRWEENERRWQEEQRQRQEVEEKNQKIRGECEVIAGRLRQEHERIKARLARLPVSAAPLLCLLGKVGPGGTPTAFATAGSLRPASGGRLYLQANDADLGENSGSLEVEITVAPPPPD
jgi:hypothetical protein